MFRILFLIMLLIGCSSGEEAPKEKPQQTVGLFINEPESYDGYTLFTPSASKQTFLIDNQGHKVHSWAHKRRASSVYLLPNGHLLRSELFLRTSWGSSERFGNHGAIAEIKEYDWDGQVIWTYKMSNEQYQLHHDIAPLPNGNILVIAWERLSEEQAIAQGRDPKLLDPDTNNEVWSEVIFEIKPDYISKEGGTIIWEWHLTDHLVQDFDSSKANYMGESGVYEHPERVNLNYVSTGVWKTNKVADWIHLNAIDYNPKTDQIILTSREFSEFWIIDHSINTDEAAGRAGDLLYRYGNPQAYNQGTRNDQQLFYPHDAHWIPDGLPGAGHILVFNNGADRLDGSNYSSVLEIAPIEGEYGKANLVWSYSAPEGSTFFSSIVSSSQRLPNGNTLIDEGDKGRFFEVTPEGKIVWLYVNALSRRGILTQGKPIPILKEIKIPGVLQNITFRVARYPKTYPAFEGKDLTPKGFIEKYPESTP